MKIVWTILLLFVLSSKSYSQTGKGTHVILAICKDGILIGADSRLGLSYNNQTDGYIDGYTDDVQKIFKTKNLIMGFMGSFEIIDYQTMFSVINRYESVLQETDSLLTVAKKWYQFSSNNGMSGLTMVFARYENNQPILAFVNKGRLKILTSGSNILETDSSGVENEYSNKLSCKQMGPIIKKYILKYAKANHSEKYIGGDIYFLKISPDNKSTWLGKQPPKQFEDLRNLWKAYKTGNKKIVFTNEKGESNLNTWLGK